MIKIGAIVKHPKFLLVTKLSVFAVLAFIVAVSLVLAVAHLALAERIYPGVKIAEVDLSFKSKTEAAEILFNKSKDFLDEKIDLENQPSSLSYGAIVSDYDLVTAIRNAYAVGREGLLLSKLFAPLKLLLFPVKVSAQEKIDNQKLSDFINSVAQKINQPFVDAGLKIVNNHLEITPSRHGVALNSGKLQHDLLLNIKMMNSRKIYLETGETLPELVESDLEGVKQQAEKFIAQPLKLVWEGGSYETTQSDRLNWLAFEKRKAVAKPTLTQTVPFLGVRAAAQATDSFELALSVNKVTLTNFLESLRPAIDSAASDGYIVVSDGNVLSVRGEKLGKKLNVQESIAAISSALAEKNEVALKVDEVLPTVSQKKFSDLGITTLLGRGESDFSGSSWSRITNISVGAAKFNGLILENGEEFSFNEHLGPVDASGGYVPELVIRQNALVAEYGGGLCQVATTAFRMALFAGVPILERHEHAFRVGYYDWPFGPGVDATIYPPSPDFRFKNDTGGKIYIQTYLSGTRLVFEMFGPNTGRTVTYEGPYQYNVKSDGSLDTNFIRYITYPDGKVTKDEFYSHFNPPGNYPKTLPN